MDETHTLDIASWGKDKGRCSELRLGGQQLVSNFLNKTGVPSGCQGRSTLYRMSRKLGKTKMYYSSSPRVKTHRKALCRSAHEEMAATDTLVYKGYTKL